LQPWAIVLMAFLEALHGLAYTNKRKNRPGKYPGKWR